jgi:hypothetical protein
MGKSSVPPPDPRMFEILEKQVGQGDQLLEYINKSLKSNEERQGNLDKVNNRVIDQQMRLADSAEGRANDAYEFYRNKGRPVVEQSLQEARTWDNEQNIADAQNRARADIQQGFDSAAGQQQRMLTRMGVNPNSGKFAALNASLQGGKALALAGATNAAGEQRRMQGAAMRGNASNIAQGMPSQSMGWGGQAGSFGQGASGTGAQGMQSALSWQGQHMNGMNAAGNMYGNATNTYNNIYGNQMKGHIANQQADAVFGQGIGQLAGTAAMIWMRDGGKVKGPGTGTSDSVPAVNTDNGQRIQLSNGEYIIPADVVRKVGEKHFEKLIEKHHTPVRSNLGVSHG